MPTGEARGDVSVRVAVFATESAPELVPTSHVEEGRARSAKAGREGLLRWWAQ